MPAPLAKGLIITISLLCAAGLAAYENPQVRQWIDESRRKVAIALHSLGDELAPDSESRRASRQGSRDASPDASTREDEDPEAVERRRMARQEILERGRILEERRRSKQSNSTKAKSFDDLVDENGALRSEDAVATTTAAEPPVAFDGLRHRHVDGPQAANRDSTFANSAVDTKDVDFPATLTHDPPPRSFTPTQSTSPMSPPLPPKPAAYQLQRLLIDTEETSNHPSEQLLDLTPTTSASSAGADLAELRNDSHPMQSSYWSVNEWAQRDSANSAFHSSPRNKVVDTEERSEHITATSQTGSGDHASQVGSEDSDMMSDDEVRISTPESWTEVGSQVSEDF